MKRFLIILPIVLLLIAYMAIGSGAYNATPRALPLERSTPLFGWVAWPSGQVSIIEDNH